MTPHMKVSIAGVAVGLVMWWLFSFWVAVAVIVAAIAIPVVAYLMLDSNQKSRLRRARGRKQIR